MDNLVKRRVFISGSASVYGDYTEKTAKDLIRRLASRLVDEHCTIVSGYGLGVGESVVSGVMQRMYQSDSDIPFCDITETLIVHPFPRDIEDPKERAAVFARYRKHVLSSCDVAIFLFGNKMEGDRAINAQGVYTEFESVCANDNCLIIPVGATGFMAKEIWNDVKEHVSNFYSWRNGYDILYNGLNAEVPNSMLVDNIITFMNNVVIPLRK